MSFKTFCFNKEDGSCFGRTGKSWCLVFLFYLVYFSFLAAFFMGMMSVFMWVHIQEKAPSLTGKQSLLRLNPGLSIRPRISNVHNFIQLTKRDSTMNRAYLAAMQTFFDENYPSNGTTSVCTNPSDVVERSCKFDLTSLKECMNPKNSLANERPCYYIKMNSIYGWLPKISKDGPHSKRAVSVKCRGQNPLDQKLLGKPVYYPSSSSGEFGEISTDFFPFLGKDKGYQPPLVAVQFPEMPKNTLLLIECYTVGLDNDGDEAEYFKFDTTFDT